MFMTIAFLAGAYVGYRFNDKIEGWKKSLCSFNPFSKKDKGADTNSGEKPNEA